MRRAFYSGKDELECAFIRSEFLLHCIVGGYTRTAGGALTCDDIRTKHEWMKEFEKCPKVNRGANAGLNSLLRFHC